jgi:Fe/S biogenesis protein NfuA
VIDFTENAVTEIAHLIEQTEAEEELALRMAILGRGPGGFRYDLAFVHTSDHRAEDIVLELDGFDVFVDRQSADLLEGATVDFQTELNQRGFRIDNPNTGWKDPLADKVQRVLDEQVNPAIAAHGGFITLHRVADGIAYISMGGGCQGCGMAAFTLTEGIEAQLLQAVPELKGIQDLTDHAAGTDPYYAATEQGESPVA